MNSDSNSPTERRWYIVGRWQELAGETHANLLRVVAIGAFYSIQLIHRHGFAVASPAEDRFHRGASLLAAIGVFCSLAVQLSIRRRFFPPALKFLSTAADLALVTGVAALGAGPQSPMRLAYFVVIVLASLRFNLPLVWFATLGSLVGYLMLVGRADRVWFDAEHAVPPVEQLVTLASLGLVGILTGQVLRRMRSLATQYQSLAEQSS